MRVPVLCSATLFAATLCFGQASGGLPIAKQRLKESLAYRILTPDEVIDRLKARGVAFELSAEDLDSFRQEFVSGRVVQALMKASKTEAAAKEPPYSLPDVVALIKLRGPNKAAQDIAERGVNFPLTPAANRQIWAAGGNRLVMGEVLLSSLAAEKHSPLDQLLPIPEETATAAEAEPPAPPASVSAAPAPAVAAAPAKPLPLKAEEPRKEKKAKEEKPKEERARKEERAPEPVRLASGAPVQSFAPATPAPEAAAPAVAAPVVSVPVQSPANEQITAPAPVTPPAVPAPGEVPQIITVAGSLQATRLVSSVQPQFPLGVGGRRGGNARIEIIVNREGKVRQTKFVGGDPLFSAAAQSAVRRWEYRPAIINGVPVEVRSEVEIVFKGLQ